MSLTMNSDAKIKLPKVTQCMPQQSDLHLNCEIPSIISPKNQGSYSDKFNLISRILFVRLLNSDNNFILSVSLWQSINNHQLLAH